MKEFIKDVLVQMHRETTTDKYGQVGISSANVPAVRVRNYNEETGETEDGTVIDATLNTYLVMPDYNLGITVRWDKMNCDVLR